MLITVVFKDEEFRPIILEAPDGALFESKRYLISNYGRILNIETNKYVTPNKRTGSNQGYLQIALHDFYKNKKFIRNTHIHRLVCNTFSSETYFKGCVVNHKNGNRYNNHISNLEHCTGRYNSQDSQKRRGNNIYTNKMTNFILKQMRKSDWTVPSIVDKFLIEFPESLKWKRKDIMVNVNNLYNRNKDKLHLPSPDKLNYLLSESQAKSIMEMLTEDNWNMHDICIKIFGSKYIQADAESKATMKYGIRNIYKRKTFKNLSKNIKFGNMNKGAKFPTKIIEDVCKDIASGYGWSQIISKYKISSNFYSSIKNKQSYTDISNKYF